MNLANQLPALGGVGGPGNLQIWLGEGRLDEIEYQRIVVNGDKVNGRRDTYGSKYDLPYIARTMILTFVISIVSIHR